MHKNAYSVGPAAVSSEICDEIIRIGDLLDDMDAKVGRKDPTASVSRKSKISWMNQEQSDKHDLDFTMLYGELNKTFDAVREAAGWGEWEISAVQPYQYTRYGPGGHYAWHPDAHREIEGPDSEFPGLIRKLSFTLLLSDPDEYEGGELLIEDHQASGPDEIWFRITNMSLVPEYNTKGTMIVFPSHLWHQVKPIKRGLRRSLVGWFMGPPWV